MYGEIDLFCVTFWVTLDAEKASHFVVQWTEGDDQGMLSRVPGSSIVSKPPLNVGCTILLKYAGKKGAIEKSKAQIMSKGNECMVCRV